MDFKIIFTRWPFRKKLLLLSMVIFLPAFGIIIASGISQRQHAIVKAQDEALLLVRSLAAQQEQIAIATKTMLSTLAHMPEVQSLDAPACNRIFAELHRLYPFYASILAMTPDGYVFAAHSPLEPGKVNQSDRKYFQDAVSSLDFSAGEYIIGRVSQKTSFNYSFPVLDANKKLVAVLTAGLNLQKFGQFISMANLPQGSAVIFDDHKGLRLFRFPENGATPIGKPSLKGYFDAVSGSAAEGLFEWTALDGVKRINAFKQLRLRENSPPYLYMVVGLPKDPILHKANLNMLRDLTVLGFAAFLALYLAWILGNVFLIRPINRLVAATQQFGRGDMDTRTGLPHTPDELGRLAQSFDDMAALLEMRNLEREKAEQALSQAYIGMEGRVQARTSELSAINAAFLREINERKQTEAALRLSEARLSKGEQVARLGHWELDSKNQKLSWSDEVYRLFAKDPDTFVPTLEAVLDTIHPEDRSQFSQLMDKALAEGMGFTVDYRIIMPDGSFRYMQEKVEITSNGIENPTRIFGTIQDITEGKQTEEELNNAQEYLENIFANSADGIGIVDEHGNIQRWNKAAEEIYKYTIDELRGKPAADLYADQIEFHRMLTKLRQEGSVNNYEINMRKKDGSIFPASLSIGLLHSDNKVIGSVTVARDLTETKNNMTQLQLVNEKLQVLVAETEQHSREVTLINGMVESLQSCLQADEAYPIIARSIQELFATMSGSLFILDPVSNLLEAVSSWGKNLAGEKVFAPDDCWAIRRGHIYLSEDSAQKGLCRHLPDKAELRYLCIPLTGQGERVGMLHLQAHREDAIPNFDHLKHVAVTIGDNISMALANIRLREILRHQVVHDSLTGLFNRRYLDETLKREIYRVRRKKAPLGVIMMDLDYFKRFNDTYGHEAGDRLLETLGQFLKTQVRKEDVACRYGGEEFVLIMPEASLDVTQKRAEAIRQGVSQLQVSLQGKVLELITVSLGVASFPEHGANEEDLLRAADNAMYCAKEQGRNRVVVSKLATKSNEDHKTAPTKKSLKIASHLPG